MRCHGCLEAYDYEGDSKHHRGRFKPPKPNELTEIRRSPTVGHSMHHVGSEILRCSMSIRLLICLKFVFGAIIPVSRIDTASISPARLLAPCRCPILVFTAPI